MDKYCDIVVGCFYFTLGNLHPKFRSALKFIQLVALIKNEDIKRYGIDSVLKHIVADIKPLEKVIIIIIIDIATVHNYIIL